MKASNYLRILLPAVGLGAFLALAPAARAQADVSPDHFDDGVSDSVPAKKAPAKAKPAAAQASSKKAATKTTAQSAPAKKPGQAAQQSAVVAVSDKRKTTAKKSDQH